MNIDYLPLVTEEAGEVLQAIGKCQRFGLNRYWAKKGHTNATALALEVGDLLEVIDRLDLPESVVATGRARKRERLKKYAPEIWKPEA